MSQDVRRKLVDAIEAKAWTMERLRKESRLKLSRASLHRKVYGYLKGRNSAAGKRGRRVYQSLTVDEYRAIGLALGVLTTDESEALAGLGLRAAA